MQITVNGILQELDVTSHILESDALNLDRFLMFHCWRCGKALFQFSGRVVMSMPGATESLLPIIYLCRSCKQRHLINSIL